ncbi:MAG TPA: PAC2 family protein [Actinocrinis sp.]|uniref:PAC2 family protein n=1 Tax=Actinocrinis sp. TaxID=1920516 RepID=UPI002DDD04C5|nr:PAC2 family protein [Actinocrinis sp.]HEV2343834.1 PAC2 family protein [Actinocrinis sp.]
MIELEELPELVDPVMVAAFEGWNDAADAASNAVRHLAEVLDADLFGAMDAEDYYDFQVNRPVLALDDEGEREIVWPTTRFSVARVPVANQRPGTSEAAYRDVVLVHGIEPNMRWRSFCEELFDLARDLGVTTIVSLGALLADVPHTRPVPVSGSSSNEDLQGSHGLDKPTLQGPTGINGVLQEMARHEDIDLVSFWAAVPHYVAQAPCPKATLALIRRIEDVLDLTIPLGELPEEARAWETGVDELAAEDAEVAEYVRTLEEAKDTAELPEASGEAIAREFERYLRRHERRRRGGGDDGPA